MYYPDEIIEEVRMRNDIVEVIGEYVTLKKRGSNYVGLCPFHNEKTPSFTVQRSTQLYYCFGCGKGGNVFTFLMEYENMTYPEAVKHLAARANMTLPEQTYSQKEREARDRKSRMFEMNREAAKFYYMNLRAPKGASALNYLRERGLSEDTIRRFGLGYAGKYSDRLYRYLKEAGFDPAMMRDVGLIDISEEKGVNDRFWNRVIFPIMDMNSRVIAFGGRVMGEGEPKYLNSPQSYIYDKSRHLFGLFAARKSKKKAFLLCEGYMDVISLHQAGFDNAVASLGTSLTSEQVKLMKRFVHEAYITYDSDGAGTKAAIRAIPMLREEGIGVRVVRLEPYKDPDELIKAVGAEEYQRRIDTATDGILFTVEQEAKQYDRRSPQGKIDFCHSAARILNNLGEEVERRAYREEIARIYGLTDAELTQSQKNEARKNPSVPGAAAKGARPVRPKKEKEYLAQRTLLAWMAEEGRIIDAILPYLKAEDFADPLLVKMAAGLIGQHASGGVDPAALIDRFKEQDEQEKIAAILHINLSDIHSSGQEEKVLKELLYQVIIDKLGKVPLNEALEGRKMAEKVKNLKKIL